MYKQTEDVKHVIRPRSKDQTDLFILAPEHIAQLVLMLGFASRDQSSIPRHTHCVIPVVINRMPSL